jgi:internalin A
MLNFQLCYQLPENHDTYIAPQLLTAKQPDYEWDTEDNLILHYSSPAFMPKGIITRFIVAMHREIEEQRNVWKSGVVLRRDQTRAEVIENYGRRDIQVRVAGQHKKELMTIIVYELDKIYQSYHGLEYNKLIPCNCGRCKNSQDPHFYSFEKLRMRIADRQYQVQCDLRPYEMVDARALIDDVIDIPLLNKRADAAFADEGRGAASLYQIINAYGGNVSVEGRRQVTEERSVNITNSNINAPVVIADTIQNAFNTVEQSGLEDQLKETLQQLIKAVTEISNSIPQDQAQSMANDVEALSKELTTSKRPSTVQRILGDIRDTATTVGQIATPVLDLIGKLSPLVSGTV